MSWIAMETRRGAVEARAAPAQPRRRATAGRAGAVVGSTMWHRRIVGEEGIDADFAIVCGTFDRGSEDRVSFRDSREALRRRGVRRVVVGMVFLRKSVKGSFFFVDVNC